MHEMDFHSHPVASVPRRDPDVPWTLATKAGAGAASPFAVRPLAAAQRPRPAQRRR
eukprot:COSAG04_NODE_19147_length_423_cov_1.114198_1_plen_55_part_10